jgi:hypothetical protein
MENRKMRFLIIIPKTQSVIHVRAHDTDGAKEVAELDLNVDHGSLGSGIGIIVKDFGLCEPQPHYFAIGKQLFAGNAVIYQYNIHDGETTDILERNCDIIRDQTTFYNGFQEVETAIENGLITRPYIAINNEILSIWENGAFTNLQPNPATT